MSLKLLLQVHKFSKFIHGTATLLPDMIAAVPYWIDDESVRPSMLQSAGYREAHQAEYATCSNASSWSFCLLIALFHSAMYRFPCAFCICPSASALLLSNLSFCQDHFSPFPLHEHFSLSPSCNDARILQ